MLAKYKTLSSQSSIGITKTFSKRFSDYEKIIVINNKSINSAIEQFTNFLSETGDKDKHEALKEICRQISNGKLQENKFEVRELNEYGDEEKRVVRLINSYGNEQITSITEVVKYKYRNVPQVQLYLFGQDKNLLVLLVDVHHLALKGDLYISGQRKKYDREKIYNKFKNRTYCISNIL